MRGIEVPGVGFGPACFPFFFYFSLLLLLCADSMHLCNEKLAFILMESLDLGVLTKRDS